jgi:hypothetical protein
MIAIDSHPGPERRAGHRVQQEQPEEVSHLLLQLVDGQGA